MDASLLLSLASRRSRGNWLTKNCFWASRFARGYWLTNTWFLASHFARGNWLIYQPYRRWGISKLMTSPDSASLITRVSIQELSLIPQKTRIIDNFRSKLEVRGWTSKLMTSSDSMCWIIPVSTVKLLRISWKPWKEIISGLTGSAWADIKSDTDIKLARSDCPLFES